MGKWPSEIRSRPAIEIAHFRQYYAMYPWGFQADNLLFASLKQMWAAKDVDPKKLLLQTYHPPVTDDIFAELDAAFVVKPPAGT